MDKRQREFNKHHRAVLAIRNEAISRLLKSKELYMKSDNPDELILSMYDLEIEFLQKTLIDISN